MIDRLLAEICTKIILSAQKELESGYDDPMLNVQNLCRRILAGDEFWNETLLHALAVRTVMLLWHNQMELNSIQDSSPDNHSEQGSEDD